MDPNRQKEQFSDAFLQAIAAVGECTCCRPPVDDDSVDWTLSKKIARRPKLDLQLKCTADLPNGGTLSFALKKKNYDDLRMTDLMVPRALVVVTVPTAVQNWVAFGAEQMVLRHKAYWYSLRGFPDSSNTTSVTIPIPESQVFTVEVLNSMMETISEGGLP